MGSLGTRHTGVVAPSCGTGRDGRWCSEGLTHGTTARPRAGGGHTVLAHAETARGQRRPVEEGAGRAQGPGPRVLSWVTGRWMWGDPPSAR